MLHFLILSIFAFFVNPKKTYEKHSPVYRFLIGYSSRVMMKVMRIHVKTEGQDLLPKDKHERFLLVSNHRSNFDPILTWGILSKYDIAFVSKPENFKVPIFGRLIRRCCFLPIDRSDPKSSMKTLIAAAQYIKEDKVSFGIYPEGTRSKSGELLPFHNGVFKVAKMADVPILVMTIEGTESIHANFPFHPSYVTIKYVRVYKKEQVSASSTKELGDSIRQDMLTHMGQEGVINE